MCPSGALAGAVAGALCGAIACACPQSGGNVKQFKIYRWNPDDGKKPHVQTYSVDLDE